MSIRLAVLALKPVGEAAFSHLLAAARQGVEVVGACSNASPEGTWWKSAGIARRCGETGLPFLASEQADDAALGNFLERIAADMILSIQFPRLISAERLTQVADAALNLHLAPLPAYRGYFGPTHALLNGDPDYGVTLHWMDQGADTGDICLEERFTLAEDETGISLYRKATAAGIATIDRLIALLAAGSPLPRRAQAGPGRYLGRASLDGMRRIAAPEELDRKSRAFFFPGFEPAYIMADGRRHYVLPTLPEWPDEAAAVVGTASSR